MIENLSIQDVYCYKCDIILTVASVNCIIVNGQPIYEVVINTTNPYGDTFYGSFSAPNDQGFFTPSTITIPPNPANHTLYFYPLNNFSGGTIDIRMLTPLNNLTCTSDFKITFPHCVTNRNALQDEMVHIEDLLVVAPNPSREQTTVFYSYFSNTQSGTTQKTIEMVDMLGRKILTLPLKETKGSIDIDTFGIASGQYLVLMKENDKVIKNVKLVVQH